LRAVNKYYYIPKGGLGGGKNIHSLNVVLCQGECWRIKFEEGLRHGMGGNMKKERRNGIRLDTG
jgi:hypothetical protein